MGRQFGPEDRPAELLDFDFDAWTRPEDQVRPPGYARYPADEYLELAAYDRWSKARMAWADEHGVSRLEILLADRHRLFPDGVG